jgi:hypothetical protein
VAPSITRSARTTVNTFGAQVYYRGSTTPGGGVLTLTVQHEEHAEDEDGQPDPPATIAVPIDVLPPEGAVVSPYCTPGSLGREPPYLAPASGEVMVSWRFILDGRIEGGDDGTLPVSAPALELLDHSGSLAWYRVPSTPGLVEVSSTTYDSSFQLEIHDPADAVLVMGVTGLNFIGDAIQVDVHSEVDGRVVCAEPAGKIVTSETPAVCLIASGGQTAESQQISAAYVDVVPIAAGDCRIRATVADTALDEAIQFAVAPLGPEDMWWEHTCEGETTCGLVCQSSVIEDSGCEWTSTDEYTCDDDPAEIRCHYQQRYVGLECAETAEFPPYRVECWE